MPIAVATDGGWKRPVVGPGLEAFAAGDAKAVPAPMAAGGPGDAAPLTSLGNQARIALDEPKPAQVAAPPAQGTLSQKDLVELLKALTALLASVTNLVAKMMEQRGIAAPAAA